MNFASDNWSPVCPEIMEAIVRANSGFAPAYSNDAYTEKLRTKVSEIFEHEVSIFFTSTGTASNSLALSVMAPSYGVVYCGHGSHLNSDEIGIFSGAKITGLPTQIGCIFAHYPELDIHRMLTMRPHEGKPCAISITQANEMGYVYDLTSLEEIKNLAEEYDLYLHMDGARFANALAYLGDHCTPADITWKSGIDALSFGATKNGALNAEMVIVFNQDLAQDFDYLLKKYGQLMSKSRYIAAQFLAYFENDLWLKNAAHANAMAEKMLNIFQRHEFGKHVKHYSPLIAQSNQIIQELAEPLATSLRENGVLFYDWHSAQNRRQYRFVTSWCTQQKEIDDFERLMISLRTPHRKYEDETGTE